MGILEGKKNGSYINCGPYMRNYMGPNWYRDRIWKQVTKNCVIKPFCINQTTYRQRGNNGNANCGLQNACVLPQSDRHPNLAEPVCANCYSISTPTNASIMYAQSNLQGLPVPLPET